MTPEFQSFFYPFLELCSDNKEHSLNEMRDYLTKYFSLTDEDKAERVPSGVQAKFDNRIYWTKSYFIKANLIEDIRRSVFKITAKGIDFFKKHNSNISIKDLKTTNEFREFSSGNPQLHDKTIDKGASVALEEKTPEEILEESYQSIRKELAQEILERIVKLPPTFFERLVVELLVKMGYGGSIKDAGKAIGKRGDEGIDGTIKEDRLGLDVIYIQAKRWQPGNVVGRPEIHKFIGALVGQGAKKGIFITTSSFTKEALGFKPLNETKIVLIDGIQLSQLMIDYNLGVTTQHSYEIKRLDNDYFEE